MFKDSSITNNLKTGLQFYLDDVFIKDGAYFDISNTSGYYGNLSTLTKISLPQYNSGRVWATRRQNWMWESGIPISGVWVNNTLVTSGYKLNYRDGYVLFDNPVSGNVRLNYSSKYIEVRDTEDYFFLRGDTDSFNSTDGFFINGSGFNYQDKVQIPCISIKTGSTKSEAFEIGSKTKIKQTNFHIHVITSDNDTNNKIRDKISESEENYIKFFDVESSKRSGVYPISKDGFLVNSSGNYSYLAENFKFKESRSDAFVLDVINEGSVKLPNGLHHGTLKLTLETILSV